MAGPMQNIPDVAYIDYYRRRRGTKLGRLELDTPVRKIPPEVSLLPNIPHQIPRRQTERSSKVPLNPYPQKLRVNSLQKYNNDIYLKSPEIIPYSNKKFPNFKLSGTENADRSKYAFKPGMNSSIKQLNVENECGSNYLHGEVDQTKIYESKRYKNEGDYFKDRVHHSTNLKPTKKVKWEDGYCATPSLEWNHRNDNRKRHYSKPRKTYSYNNFLTYNSQQYPNRYENYDYTKYDYSKYEPSLDCSMVKSFRPQNISYRKRYPYEHIKTSRYGNPGNWLYLQDCSRNYNPYYYGYDGIYYDTPYVNSGYKSYRHSDTQYDLIDRVQNKKLQVSCSESTRSSRSHPKVENQKVGHEITGLKLTHSNHEINQGETAGSQVDEKRAAKSLHNLVISKSESKLPDCDKLNAISLLSRILLELTDKLKISEHTMPSVGEKCILVNSDTQYEASDAKNETPIRQTYLSKKKLSSSTSKLRKSHTKFMQSETTQYEDLSKDSEYKKKTPSVLDMNHSFGIREFEKQFFDRNQDQDICHQMQSTRKHRGIKAEVSAVRIYPKRLANKKNTAKRMRKLDDTTNGNEIPLISRTEPELKQAGFRSYVNSIKDILRFHAEKECKIRTNHQESLEEVHSKVKNQKHAPSSKKMKFLSCGVVKGRRKKNFFNREKKGKSAASSKLRNTSVACSSKSDFSGYLQKYVVKLLDPKEEMILYDVKPKFCDYLNNKGIKKKILEKLRSTKRYIDH